MRECDISITILKQTLQMLSGEGYQPPYFMNIDKSFLERKLKAMLLNTNNDPVDRLHNTVPDVACETSELILTLLVEKLAN